MGLIHSFFNHLKKRKKSRYFFLGAVTFFYILFLANTSSLIARNLSESPKNEIKNPIAYGQVKGEATEPLPTATLTPTPLPTEIPTPTRRPSPTPGKNLYRIAVFGDSMVDTMGETLEYLEQSLKKKYPGVNFALYNYGQGSVNVEEGLDKFNQTFSYSSRLFAPLPQIQADIIILGSFAYNPMTPYSRDRHWLGLTKLIDEAEKTSAKIYLLAEIAPLRREFGKGPNGVNWDTATVYTHSGHIVEQLNNAIDLAKIKNVPLINVYELSFDKKKNEGKRKYINYSDGIHPSVEGHKLTADKIASTIELR